MELVANGIPNSSDIARCALVGGEEDVGLPEKSEGSRPVASNAGTSKHQDGLMFRRTFVQGNR